MYLTIECINWSHKRTHYNYSKKTFTRSAKTNRISGDQNNERPDKWSSTAILSPKYFVCQNDLLGFIPWIEWSLNTKRLHCEVSKFEGVDPSSWWFRRVSSCWRSLTRVIAGLWQVRNRYTLSCLLFLSLSLSLSFFGLDQMTLLER